MSGGGKSLFDISSRLDRRRLVLAGVAALCAMAVGNLIALAGAAATPGLVSDFFAFWSFGKFVHAEPPAAIYDPAVLHGFQMRLGVNATLPFLYPPGILLLLWPLALCSYVAAFALWIGITLAIYLASLWRRRGWALATLMVLAAPASAICAGLGQTGFLVGGLLIAGLRLAPGRPVLAGIVLGLAAVKPQLVLLLPLALASARLWRCLVAAAATVLALMLLSSFLLGWRIWPEWAAAAPRLADAVVGLKSTLLPMMPTVAGNAELLGAGSTVVVLVQVAAAGIAAWAIWRAFRNGPGAAAAASLLAGSFLATPFALVGDLPLVTGAVLLLVQERVLAGETFRATEVLILGLAVWLPYLMIGFAPFPISTAVLGLLLAVALGSGATAPRPLDTSLQAG